MSVVSVDKDFDRLTLTLVAEFAASAEQVWQLWADPRQLERWWGPPTFPATFDEHDLTPGGSARYHMAGPEGEKYHAYWRVLAVDPPRSLEFSDGFADADGAPNPDLPVSAMRMELSEQDGRTRMELVSTFESRSEMDQLVGMGMDEGLSQAVGQMDDLLAA